jgi:hypothetical protein
MRVAALIPLIAAICNLVVAVFVLTHKGRSTLSRVFLLWALSIVVWNFGTYFMFIVPQDREHDALFWARFLQFGVIFIPVSLIHLSLLIAQIRVGRAIYFLYAFHCLLALSNFTSFFIPRVDYKQRLHAWYSVAVPGSGCSSSPTRSPSSRCSFWSTNGKHCRRSFETGFPI